MALEAGVDILRKALAMTSGLAETKVGIGARFVGRRFASNVSSLGSRNVRSAMLARAAVGAVGGGLYGQYTRRDWRGGAAAGALGGAAYWSVGGLRGLRLAGAKSGLIGRASPGAAAMAGWRRNHRQVQAARTGGAGYF